MAQGSSGARLKNNLAGLILLVFVLAVVAKFAPTAPRYTVRGIAPGDSRAAALRVVAGFFPMERDLSPQQIEARLQSQVERLAKCTPGESGLVYYGENSPVRLAFDETDRVRAVWGDELGLDGKILFSSSSTWKEVRGLFGPAPYEHDGAVAYPRRGLSFGFLNEHLVQVEVQYR